MQHPVGRRLAVDARCRLMQDLRIPTGAEWKPSKLCHNSLFRYDNNLSILIIYQIHTIKTCLSVANENWRLAGHDRRRSSRQPRDYAQGAQDGPQHGAGPPDPDRSQAGEAAPSADRQPDRRPGVPVSLRPWQARRECQPDLLAAGRCAGPTTEGSSFERNRVLAFTRTQPAPRFNSTECLEWRPKWASPILCRHTPSDVLLVVHWNDIFIRAEFSPPPEQISDSPGARHNWI